MQGRSRFIGGLLLLILGAWVLHSFLDLLAWAVVLAISTWPIYQQLLASTKLPHKVSWVALALTLLIAASIFVPAGYGFSRLIQEAQLIGQIFNTAQTTGIPCPEWIEHLPLISSWAKENWLRFLGSSEAAKASLHWIDSGSIFNYTKDFANQLIHRFFGVLIILLTLLFIYQHGQQLGQQILNSSRKIFGDKGYRYTLHANSAVRSTVNGMILVGLGKGLLMGPGYAIAGLDNPAILGAITGIFAMIPFAAKLIFSACALVLVAQGHPVEATGLFTYGMVLTLIADNYIRPVLIGGAVKLPFLWTLLGIFGGMETCGMLGLFLGPALMAVLMSIWRDWLIDLNKSASNFS